jgi:hypothetical protein
VRVRAKQLRLLTIDRSQSLDCEAPVPARMRSRSARRASKEVNDLDRYQGPLAVLAGAFFLSDDDLTIEGPTAGRRRRCMNSAKGRRFNTSAKAAPWSWALRRGHAATME